MAEFDKTFEGVIQLVLIAQYVSTCTIELATFLKERACKDTKELSQHANKYLEAHENQLKDVCKSLRKKTTSSEGKIYCITCKKSGHEAKDCYWRTSQKNSGESIIKTTRCFFCHSVGHTIATCVKIKEADQGKIKDWAGQFPDTRRCFNCGVVGHIVRDCERLQRKK